MAEHAEAETKERHMLFVGLPAAGPIECEGSGGAQKLTKVVKNRNALHGIGPHRSRPANGAFAGLRVSECRSLWMRTASEKTVCRHAPGVSTGEKKAKVSKPHSGNFGGN